VQYDWSKINVQFESTPGKVDEILQVADGAACGIGGGWYYDNPSAPTRIHVCASTCAFVQQNSKGKLNVLFGCPTKKLTP
jgi:hypothetical protein